MRNIFGLDYIRTMGVLFVDFLVRICRRRAYDKPVSEILLQCLRALCRNYKRECVRSYVQLSVLEFTVALWNIHTSPPNPTIVKREITQEL